MTGPLPMGAVFVARQVHDALMQGPPHVIELFHGYTYSGHPVACAAGLACLDIYEREGLFTRVQTLQDKWVGTLHSLRASPHVADIRTLGLMAGIEIHSRPNAPGRRATEAFTRCLKNGLLVRVSGEVVALSPPLIVEVEQIEQMATILAEALAEIG